MLGYKDRHTNGYTDTWTGTWPHTRIHGYTDGRADTWIPVAVWNGHMGWCVVLDHRDARMGLRTGVRLYRHTDRHTDGYTYQCGSVWTHTRMLGAWTDTQTRGQRHGHVHRCARGHRGMGMPTHAHVQVCAHLPALEHTHRQTCVHTYLHMHTCTSCALYFHVSIAYGNTHTRAPMYIHRCVNLWIPTGTLTYKRAHTHKHRDTFPMHIHNRTHAHTQRHTLLTPACTGAGRHMYILHMCTHTGAPAAFGHSGLLEISAHLNLGTLLGRWGPSGSCVGLCSCWVRDRSPQVPCATLRHT